MYFPPVFLTTNQFALFFQMEHDSAPRTIRFRDFSEANIERFNSNIHSEFATVPLDRRSMSMPSIELNLS